ALPGHLHRSWERDIELTLGLQPDHVSLYGLTIESHTPLSRWADRGSVVEGTEERYEEEFLYAHDAMSAAGFEHYEVSNFARPGQASRHNSVYWTGSPYAAAGPSAHSFDGATRRWNVPMYSEWIRRLASNENVIGGEEVLTEENRDAEEVYLGLRTRRGLAIGDRELERAEKWVASGWAAVTENSLARTTDFSANRLNHFDSAEPNQIDSVNRAVGGPHRLTLTPMGWLRLDSLAADLSAARSRNHTTLLSPTPSHCYI
ncbi:MAG: hypothetical protein ABR585_08940, partial [Gemmatimonadaceae bacterium]